MALSGFLPLRAGSSLVICALVLKLSSDRLDTDHRNIKKMKMDQTPKFRNFTSWTKHTDRGAARLIVFGEVEAPPGLEMPHLINVSDPRDNGPILELDLALRNNWNQNRTTPRFCRVRYEMLMPAGAYMRVELLWLGAVVCTLDVREYESDEPRFARHHWDFPDVEQHTRIAISR